jgi:putative peptidoglycan lipid II flippase
MAAAVALTVVVAHRFGSDRQTDIVFNALIIPNALVAVIYSLVTPVFVSAFKSIEVGRGTDEAWAFGRSASRVTAVVGAAAVGVGILLSPILARAVSPGFLPDDAARVGRTLQAAFLVVFLTLNASVLRGFLNAQGSFVVPAADVLAANLTGVATIVIAAPRWGAASIVAGVVAGGIARVAIQMPAYLMRRRAVAAPVLHPAMRQVWEQLWPVLCVGALFAISVGFVRGLASEIPGEGAVSCLSYAERIFGASNDLVFVSFGMILLPSLARHAAGGETDRLRNQVGKGMRLAAFFGIPAAVGLFLLAEPVVALFCQRGRFGPEDTVRTAQALRGYAASFSLSGAIILQQAFYALGETRPILVSGVAFFGATVLSGPPLARAFGLAGLGWTHSVALAAGGFISLVLFGRRAGWPDIKGLFAGVLRTSFCAAIMGAAVWALSAMHVLFKVAIGAAVFALLARFVCPEEWRMTRKLWSRAEGSA